MALIGTSNPQFYNQVPDLSVAVASFNEKEAVKAIDRLGEIFVNHGVHDKFALIINHRHFELGSGEILVESIQEDHTLSVAVPWKVEEEVGSPVDTEYWNMYGFEQKRLIIPRTWAFVSGNYQNTSRKTGMLESIEYVATNEAEANPDPNFVSDLYVELKSLGLEEVFGLRRKRSQNGDRKSGYETTPSGIRANVTKYADSVPSDLDKSKLIKVVFYIDENGRSAAGDWCQDHCQQHCHGCYCYIVDWH